MFVYFVEVLCNLLKSFLVRLGSYYHPNHYSNNKYFVSTSISMFSITTNNLICLCRGLGAVLGVCLPEGATDDILNMQSVLTSNIVYKEADLIEVDSIAAVSSSTYMDTYYRNDR